MKCAGADLEIERLEHYAAPGGPELLELKNQILEGIRRGVLGGHRESRGLKSGLLYTAAGRHNTRRRHRRMHIPST